MINIEEFWTPEKTKIIPSGPGSNGEPVETEPENEQKKSRAYSEYGFNQFVSDQISLDRSIKDTRHSAWVLIEDLLNILFSSGIISLFHI